jgi:bacterioferritin-associated ferredoxin
MSPTTIHRPERKAATELICFCRAVPEATVRAAVSEGRATTLNEVQRATTACTRCFGCRFEIERVLREELGDAFEPADLVKREDLHTPWERLKALAGATRRRLRPDWPLKMYMPVLEGFEGNDVHTRLVLFNLHDDREDAPHTVSLRADLTRLDGTREDVWEATLPPRHTAALDVAELRPPGALPDGIGLVKLVLDAKAVRSLRPYFHFTSPGGVTATHEKRAPRRPDLPVKRSYHWVFPVTRKKRREEAWFFMTNTLTRPIEGCSLVLADTDGNERAVEVPRLTLDQAACIPLHEHFPEVGEGTVAGTVRLTPSVHVAGWMIRRDVEADLWRVQHL